MEVTLLGTGASSGVPLIGCSCSVCGSSDPRNKRTRTSIVVRHQNTTLLIDSSPDLRAQALATKLNRIDAILFTHAHADHVHGIDDLRSFNYLKNAVLPAYADQATFDNLKERFGYAFLPPVALPHWVRPALTAHEIVPGQSFTVGEIAVLPFQQFHGETESLGFRMGDIAYSTDVHHFPESTFALLEGLDLWVIDCLRYAPAPTHAHLELTLEWIARAKPKRAVLTHMSHDFDYEELRRKLPDGVEPGYDGMVI